MDLYSETCGNNLHNPEVDLNTQVSSTFQDMAILDSNDKAQNAQTGKKNFPNENTDYKTIPLQYTITYEYLSDYINYSIYNNTIL